MKSSRIPPPRRSPWRCSRLGGCATKGDIERCARRSPACARRSNRSTPRQPGPKPTSQRAAADAAAAEASANAASQKADQIFRAGLRK